MAGTISSCQIGSSRLYYGDDIKRPLCEFCVDPEGEHPKTTISLQEAIDKGCPFCTLLGNIWERRINNGSCNGSWGDLQYCRADVNWPETSGPVTVEFFNPIQSGEPAMIESERARTFCISNPDSK